MYHNMCSDPTAFNVAAVRYHLWLILIWLLMYQGSLQDIHVVFAAGGAGSDQQDPAGSPRARGHDQCAGGHGTVWHDTRLLPGHLCRQDPPLTLALAGAGTHATRVAWLWCRRIDHVRCVLLCCQREETELSRYRWWKHTASTIHSCAIIIINRGRLNVTRCRHDYGGASTWNYHYDHHQYHGCH